MSELLPIFISCPKGLEDTLINELTPIIKSNVELAKRDGGASASLDFEDLTKCMISSRIASRIFLYLTGFNFHNEKEIHKNLVNYSWDQVIRTDHTFKFSTILDFAANRYFKNSMILSLMAKDALADWFVKSRGKRPDVETSNPDVSFLVRIEDDTKRQSWRLSLYVDLCGQPLSNRGYRNDQHMAPLRENLAAGIILNTDWNHTEHLLDPMCGSGTLLIEALYQKANLPASYVKIRSFIKYQQNIWSMQHQNWFTYSEEYKKTFNNLIDTAWKESQSNLNAVQGVIYGSDISSTAITECRNTISTLKLQDFIAVEKADARKIFPREAAGIIVTNPPYGDRLGTPEEAQALIHDFTENLKANFKNYRAYIILEHGNLRKSISLKPSKNIILHNGNIECRLLRYNLY